MTVLHLRRRQLLELLGLGTVAACGSDLAGPQRSTDRRSFAPLRPPLPLPSDGLSGAQQRLRYARAAVEDRLLVPEGYRAELLAVWGDPLAGGRFGFNNDYLALLELGERALLSVNFEYISPIPWSAGFEEATGQALPLAALHSALAERGGHVDVGQLASNDHLRPLVQTVAEAAMADLGIGVLELERTANGWQRLSGSRFERRITGLSGWHESAQSLRCSGPAAEVFRQPSTLGYGDGLGDRIVGTFANCAGGTTPWGTVLSAEENFQDQVSEAVFADGSPAPPVSDRSAGMAAGWKGSATPSDWQGTSTAGWWNSIRASPISRR